jgi:hypothetical protein
MARLGSGGKRLRETPDLSISRLERNSRKQGERRGDIVNFASMG